MKTQDWSAVTVMCLVGLVCLYFAIEAVLDNEVICLSRGCARYISLDREPSMYYFNVGGLFFLASFLIGWSARIVFRSKTRKML